MGLVVTGAPGWLGTRLVEALCERGEEVTCLVLPGFDATNLKKMGAKIHVGDVSKKETLNGLCAGATTVFHCAGIVHPKLTRAFFEVNVEGTKNMLEAAAAEKVKKFIFVSSNSACGVNTGPDNLMNESSEEKPEKSYGKSKFLAEQLVKKYQNERKLQTVIIRPCWFYGPGQPERMTKLMKMIQSGRPLMFGDGKNLRSMTYIDSLTEALILAHKKDIANGKTYWVADARPYQTVEIYEEIARQLGVQLKPKYVPAFVSRCLELGDDILQALGLYEINIHVGGEMVKHIACESKRAQKELGYAAPQSLHEGIKASIDWCKKQKLL